MNLISTTDPPSFSFLITLHDSYSYVAAAVYENIWEELLFL